jgi:hypothetical protein
VTVRNSPDSGIDGSAQPTDAHQQGDPPEGAQHGRHAAPRAPAGPYRRRRRWLVAAAATAALSGLLAPPPSPQAAADVTDLAKPKPLSTGQAISFLGSGAPTGSIRLADTPAHTATAQPVAATLITGLAANGIPNVALNAYRVAAARMGNSTPSCGIDWSLLAGIGRVESNHGRYGGAVLQPDGTSTPRIIGPSLDGVQFAFIRDTDRGLWDGDTVQDRAVGPMQFIPSTWHAYAVSAASNRAPDPFNINDAALAAAHYLCVAGGDLRTSAGERRAVMAYNHSDSYVNEVLGLAHAYAAGIPVADIPLVGNTSDPVPAPSGYYGTTYYNAPASPGPAIGASDNTPASGPTTGASSRPAASKGSSPGASGAPAGSGTSAGQPASDAGSGTSTSGSGTGTPTGSGTAPGSDPGSGPAPAGAPAPAPIPVPELPAATVPKPPVVSVPKLPGVPAPELPATPVCVPTVLTPC